MKRKIISLLATAAILTSGLVMSVSAAQSNMEVNVPRFSTEPTFDGCVSKEEWGEPTAHVVTEGAATVDDDTIGENAEYGLKNIFYWFSGDESFTSSLSYDMWLRWDDTNFYVAVVVNDPDPFSMPYSGEEMWNGDMVQFKLDTKGPSAVMLKSNPDWNYKTDDFNGNRYNKPWSSDSIFSGILALSKGTTPYAWRCGIEYGNGWDMADFGAKVGITYVANADETCTTTYEAAIPWSQIDETVVPTTGSVYGMTLVAACSDSSSLNAWLSWGHGVCSAETNSTQPRGTRGGSQAIVLTDDSVTPEAGYAVATTEAQTEAPEETSAEAVNTTKAADDSAENTSAAETTKKASTTKKADTTKKDDSGMPVGAIVGIVVAVVVVAAVVVIVVVKKKKNN